MDIIAIVLLCILNNKNASARGVAPAKYIGFTILLIVGAEFAGCMLGLVAQMTIGAYLLGLAFAGIGAYLSYRLAKGDAPQPVYQAAAAPAAMPYAPAYAQPAPAFAPPAAAAPALQPPAAGPQPALCAACGHANPVGAVFCQKCGGSLAAAPAAPAAPQPAAVPQARLAAAARAVFNNSFSPMVFDPDDTLWKAPVQADLDTLLQGGAASLPVLEGLLMQCADGRGGAISSSWWYGSEWAVKTVALLPAGEASALLLRLLQRNSNIAEWFTHVQREAAKQIGKIGGAEVVPGLRQLLAQPLPMAPDKEIAKAIEQIEGRTAPAPEPAPEAPAAPAAPAPEQAAPAPAPAPEQPAEPAPAPAPPQPKDPDAMSASELIDYMATDEGFKAGLGLLGMKLSAKLKAGFHSRPQDIEKALRTFGDEGMVARFNMVKNTMSPDDLGLLLPDLLTQYANRRR